MLVESRNDFSTFRGLIEASLSSFGAPDLNFTLFVPNNAAFEAFQAIDPIFFAALTTQDWTLHRNGFVSQHVVQDILTTNDMSSDMQIGTFNGGSLDVVVNPDLGISLVPGVNDTAFIVEANIWTSNGVVHVIDQPLAPYFFFFSSYSLASAVAQSVGLTTITSLIECAGMSDVFDTLFGITVRCGLETCSNACPRRAPVLTVLSLMLPCDT